MIENDLANINHCIDVKDRTPSITADQKWLKYITNNECLDIFVENKHFGDHNTQYEWYGLLKRACTKPKQ